MPALGSADRPLRVAVVGSGPSGFYAAQAIISSGQTVAIDMFERLPTPFGLVRYGVAPDHPKIKNVTKVFEKIAEQPFFSFFGNVKVGQDITIDELKQHYDAIVFAYGAESDKKLGIPGEDLPGSHTATSFVAWYNGHPDARDFKFDFSQEKAVIVGQGNVAMDVARVLCKTPDELAQTDISRHALDALAQSKIKEVHVYGRRGPVQASFTTPEIKEMGELSACYPVVDPQDLNLDPDSAKEIEDPGNAVRKKNYDVLKHFTTMASNGRPKKFVLHFFRGPVELIGNGRVQKAKFEINSLVNEGGKMKVKGTGRFEEIECGLFLRSVGYSGLPISGVPFAHKEGVVPNSAGRILDNNAVCPGMYVTGWVKRGPSGVIGTNKPDSEETIASLLADVSALKPCAKPNTADVAVLLRAKGVKFISFADWKKIDAAELANGAAQGKSREKFTRVSDMLAVLS